MERCGGCGLRPDDARWVAAETHWCPTCADRDNERDKMAPKPGWRVRFRQLTTQEESVTESSWSWTAEGRKAKADWRSNVG